MGQEFNIRNMSGNRTLVRFCLGNEILVQAGSIGLRFLLGPGSPIKEPIAWDGPIVMNTVQELQKAFIDPKRNQFIKAHVQ